MKFDANQVYESAKDHYARQYTRAGVNDAEELAHEAATSLWQAVQELQETGKPITKTALAQLKAKCGNQALKRYRAQRTRESQYVRHGIEAVDERGEDGGLLPQHETMRYGEGVAGMRSRKCATPSTYATKLAYDDILYADFMDRNLLLANPATRRTVCILKAMANAIASRWDTTGNDIGARRDYSVLDAITRNAYLRTLAQFVPSDISKRVLFIRRVLLEEQKLLKALKRSPEPHRHKVYSMFESDELPEAELQERTGLNDIGRRLRQKKSRPRRTTSSG